MLTARATQVTISGEDFYLSADGEINGPERRRVVAPRAGGVLHGRAAPAA